MNDRWGINWYTVAAIVVAVLSVARTARLLIHDDFPPVAWLRGHVQGWLQGSDRRMRWYDLTECPFCLAPYLSAGMLGWMYLSHLHWSWWLVNGWWAMSYVAAMVVARDEQPE